MQTYGKFFIRPKLEKQNVDKWSKERGGRLFNQVDQ